MWPMEKQRISQAFQYIFVLFKNSCHSKMSLIVHWSILKNMERDFLGPRNKEDYPKGGQCYVL